MGKRSVSQVNQQLALHIELNHEATLNDFCWGDNSWLHMQLLAMLNGEADRYIYIWGPQGSGKSHLLQACCNKINTIESGIYLPLRHLSKFDAEIIEGLEEQSLIAIDDIDEIAQNKLWEEALFHLYNRIRDKNNANLIIAGNLPPNNLGILLSDLKSRLNYGLICQLHELNDHDKIQSLIILAKKRGINLSETVGQFLLNRCTRNILDLHDILNKIDEASLREKRKITIPFIKKVLDL